jgi:hypothetical protein
VFGGSDSRLASRTLSRAMRLGGSPREVEKLERGVSLGTEELVAYRHTLKADHREHSERTMAKVRSGGGVKAPPGKRTKTRRS